jgi:NAD(P)-dependent dehydrogenase (short-subunit alcohol dehydrogenase family)
MLRRRQPMERVLITGVAGQIGSYLAEMLVSEGNAVVGLGSSPNASLPRGIEKARGSLEPDGIQSWESPLRTFDLNGRAGVALALGLGCRPHLRLVHANSAERLAGVEELLRELLDHDLAEYRASRAQAAPEANQ